MEGDSGRGELMVSAVIEKSSPNSCKQTRSSSAIGRQESVSENSIRCAWCRALRVSEFNIEWEHRPGTQNVVADVLSRNPVDNVEGSQISCAAPRALALNSREQLIQEQEEDPELGHIYRYLENPEDGSVNATVCQDDSLFCRRKNPDNWDRFLHEFSFALPTAVDETTGKTPAKLFLGRKIFTPFRKLVLVTEGVEYVGGNIEKLFDEARWQNMQRQHKTWEKYYNRKRRAVNIKVNDLVLVQTHFISAACRRVEGKFMPKFEGPYTVLEVQNNLTIWKRGRKVTVNIDQVRIYHPRNSETSSHDSINETTYEGKESSNWSNWSNSEKSRRSRNLSGNENKSVKSDKGNAGLEDLRVKRDRGLESTGTSERYDGKRPKICRKRSCRGSDYEQ
ncbi:uncharacterized protein TNCV_1927791 [Trichonephila clavipes]|nr:uncharacterized protein TNCV_1927791 [Trichonephila clavipes]